MVRKSKETADMHRSTQRVLDIFELLANNAEATGGYTLTEIAKFLNAPKSSLSPIIHTLLSNGFISVDSLTLRYSISFKMYAIGNAYISKSGINHDIQLVMEEVVDRVSETCHFAELIGKDVFYLLKVDSPEPIRMFSSPGKNLPAYTTSLGKALLSDKSKEDLMELYSEGLYAITPHTITNIDTLSDQLAKVRETHFAFEVEESTLFIRCVAVPIMVGSKIRYAISVAVPVFRYTLEKEKAICEALIEAKVKIETLLKAVFTG